MKSFFKDRKCPMCNFEGSRSIAQIKSTDFVKISPGLIKEKIYSSGILDLGDIDIVECYRCKFVYTNKYLSDYWYAKLYGEFIDIDNSKEKIFRNGKRLRYIQLWCKLSKRILNISPNDSTKINLLEFGAGWGDFLCIAEGPNVEVIAIEYDERKREYLDSNNITNYKTIDDIKEKNKFNIFFSNAVFEHLLDPIGDMEKVDKILSNDFIGFIAVPNYNMDRLKKSIEGYIDGKPVDKNISTWEHVNYFSPEKLWDFLNYFGYEIIDLEDDSIIQREQAESTEVFFRRKNK